MMPWVGLLCWIGVFLSPTHIFGDILTIALPGGPATRTTAHLPYMPKYGLIRHRQTVQTQTTSHRTWRLSMVFTICLQKFLLKFESKPKKHIQQPLK